jgi:FlaA1/EpsC-like NDP-sugar epimerase
VRRFNHLCRLSRSGLSPCFFDGRKPAQAVFTNVMGTKNVDLALRHQVEKFVMVSTDRAVNPTSVMGASKRIAEKYIHSMFIARKVEETKQLNLLRLV